MSCFILESFNNIKEAIVKMTHNKEMLIQKIIAMSTERVSKVLIFMAGMEAEHIIDEQNETKQSNKGMYDEL